MRELVQEKEEKEDLVQLGARYVKTLNLEVKYCGKDNEFRGESCLRVLWFRVKRIIIFFMCHHILVL